LLSLRPNHSFMPASITIDIHQAADVLRKGGLVAIPTETVYGLGGNAMDEEAISGIFAAKNRPSFDPLIIHQSSPERILTYATEVPEDAKKLARAFWPGPLTLVLPKVPQITDLVTAGLPTVALRVPAHPLTRQLLELLDFPVAAPSANPFGFVSPVTAQHVADQLAEKIDLILDGGACQVGLESTIVGFPGGKTTILRKGGLPVEDIEAELGHPVAIKTHSSSQPLAPGMLSRHYSPGVKLEILAGHPSDNPVPEMEALIVFGMDENPSTREQSSTPHYYDLSPKGDLEEAARQLFPTLRKIGQQQYRQVGVYLLPERGLGRAINDRLRRAAAT
jgi:L-threonylcarbamoyladenylate synthase